MEPTELLKDVQKTDQDHDDSEHCRMCGSAALRDLGRADDHPYFECRRCRFMFSPDADDAASNRFMRAECEASEADLAFLAPALRRLDVLAPLRVLGFGAGDSIVPDLLRAHGHRVIAFDPAPSTRLEVDRLTGDIVELRMGPGQFDFVYADHVFEHLTEPAAVLEELLRLTRPGGLVLIHTRLDDQQMLSDATEPCALYRHETFKQFLDPTPHQIVHRDGQTVVIERGRSPKPITGGARRRADACTGTSRRCR
jgi:SAM-dependent methyltransferase